MLYEVITIRTLTELAGADYVIDLLIAENQKLDESYGRELERKVELVSNLREFRDERVRQELLTLVDFEAEEIRRITSYNVCYTKLLRFAHRLCSRKFSG